MLLLLVVGVVNGVYDSFLILVAGGRSDPVGSHAVCWVGCRWRRSGGSDGVGMRGRGSRRLDFRGLHRSRLLAGGRCDLVDDFDGIRTLAPISGAEVAEADGLLDGKLAGDVGNVKPLW